MSDTVITVENLSKSFLIGHGEQREKYHSLRDTIVRHGRNYARKAVDMARGRQIIQGDSVEEFWALRDVSFEVKRGEMLGIIGRNGAGKSTLLKILSRITEPTTGRVTLEGRVASLLEVGTGFHPELTGYENIFLNGAILGMTRVEIKKKFDEIVDFAGVEKFLDTPVKRYSSGMYVRLAFAVAAHLEPEILIIDEVLAVGDAEFQKKCLGKMQDVAGQGRTVLFVSHNMGAILQLTTSGVVLSNGKTSFIGETNAAVQHYSSQSQTEELVYEVEHKKRIWTGSQEVKLVSLAFDGKSAIFAHEHTIAFIATLRAKSLLPPCRISLTVFRADGTAVGSCFGEDVIALNAGGLTESLIRLKGIALAPGHYYMGVAVGRGNHLEGHLDYDVVMDVLRFEVQAPIGSESQLATWSHGWGPIIFPTIETVKLV